MVDQALNVVDKIKTAARVAELFKGPADGEVNPNSTVFEMNPKKDDEELGLQLALNVDIMAIFAETVLVEIRKAQHELTHRGREEVKEEPSGPVAGFVFHPKKEAMGGFDSLIK